MAGFMAFFVAMSIHDDGIPDQLTSEQQEYVDVTLDQWICQIECFIVVMEEFTIHSEDEERYGESLIIEAKAISEANHSIWNDPLFYVKPPVEMMEKAERRSSQIRQVFSQLEKATDAMAKEIGRRRDDPGFEIDQSRYDEIAAEFEKMCPFEEPDQFCFPGDCILCKAKEYWRSR